VPAVQFASARDSSAESAAAAIQPSSTVRGDGAAYMQRCGEDRASKVREMKTMSEMVFSLLEMSRDVPAEPLVWKCMGRPAISSKE
jgi:hypothetical protein